MKGKFDFSKQKKTVIFNTVVSLIIIAIYIIASIWSKDGEENRFWVLLPFVVIAVAFLEGSAFAPVITSKFKNIEALDDCFIISGEKLPYSSLYSVSAVKINGESLLICCDFKGKKRVITIQYLSNAKEICDFMLEKLIDCEDSTEKLNEENNLLNRKSKISLIIMVAALLLIMTFTVLLIAFLTGGLYTENIVKTSILLGVDCLASALLMVMSGKSFSSALDIRNSNHRVIRRRAAYLVKDGRFESVYTDSDYYTRTVVYHGSGYYAEIEMLANDGTSEKIHTTKSFGTREELNSDLGIGDETSFCAIDITDKVKVG